MAVKRVTMDTIAKAAGVSRTSVSFVLNNTPNKNIPEATRQRILQAAQELGYYDRQANQFIAFVLHQTPDQIAQDALLGEVLRGLSEVIVPHGYYVGVFPMPLEGQTSYIDLLNKRQPSGIVLSGPVHKDSSELKSVLAQDVPTVIQGQVDSPDFYYVDVDNVQGSYTAVRHLLELGHRRIGLITNAPLNYTASMHRLRGYQLALNEAGLAFDPALVRHGAFTSTSGYNAMSDLLMSLSPVELPSAMFVASDVVALGAMQAARQYGLQIPQQISFVGYDDIPLAPYLTPALTSVRIPAADLGSHAGRILLALLQGQAHQPRSLLLDNQLRIRESTQAYLA